MAKKNVFMFIFALFMLLSLQIVSAKPRAPTLPNPPQTISENGFIITSDRTTYFCSEFISPKECLIKVILTINNTNNVNYDLENLVTYTTPIKETKFKQTTGALIPKTDKHKTIKLELKKRSSLIINLEFPINTSGKFNYTINVYSGNTYLFKVTLDPYYDYYYQNSDGSKESDILLESSPLNNLYAMSVLLPVNITPSYKLNFSMCMFAQAYVGNPQITPFFAVDTNGDFAYEFMHYFTARPLSSFYDWNCWGFTFINPLSITFPAGSRGFWGFLCSGCGLQTGVLKTLPHSNFKSDDNKRLMFVIFNDRSYPITYLDFRISALRHNCVFSKCEGIAGMTITTHHNATHFVCRYFGSKTIQPGYTLDDKQDRPRIETTGACAFGNNRIVWADIVPREYDNYIATMLMGVDTNSPSKNQSFRYNLTTARFQPFPGDNLMFALDLGQAKCNYSKVYVSETQCYSNFSKKVTYRETLPNCTQRFVHEWEWCDYQCSYSKVYFDEDNCLINDTYKVYYNETLTNCSWRIVHSYENCDYCLPDWKPFVSNNSWECLLVNGTWKEYRSYYDYELCYSETGLYSDSCDAFYPDCDKWVPCIHLDTDFNCTLPQSPILTDKISFLCYLPNGNWSCYSYAKSKSPEMVLQTNPDIFSIDDSPLFYIGSYNPHPPETIFRSVNGLLQTYITKTNLYPKNEYVAGVVCAKDSTNEIISYSRFITPAYPDMSWVVYRGDWLKENIGIIIGILLIGGLALIILTTIWRAR